MGRHGRRPLPPAALLVLVAVLYGLAFLFGRANLTASRPGHA
jgi:hypothetical protein